MAATGAAGHGFRMTLYVLTNRMWLRTRDGRRCHSWLTGNRSGCRIVDCTTGTSGMDWSRLVNVTNLLHCGNGSIPEHASGSELLVACAICGHGTVNRVDDEDSQGDWNDDDGDRYKHIDHGALRCETPGPRKKAAGTSAAHGVIVHLYVAHRIGTTAGFRRLHGKSAAQITQWIAQDLCGISTRSCHVDIWVRCSGQSVADRERHSSGSRSHAQLGQDVVDVVGNRPLAQEERLGNLPIRLAVGEQL